MQHFYFGNFYLILNQILHESTRFQRYSRYVFKTFWIFIMKKMSLLYGIGRKMFAIFFCQIQILWGKASIPFLSLHIRHLTNFFMAFRVSFFPIPGNLEQYHFFQNIQIQIGIQFYSVIFWVSDIKLIRQRRTTA